MPLIEIRGAQAALAGRTAEDVLRRVNRAVADALNAPREDVAWSTWQVIDVAAIGYEEQHPAPVVVHVYGRRTPEEWTSIVSAIEQTLAALIDIEERGILITTQPFVATPIP